jgi:hypothetical protein
MRYCACGKRIPSGHYCCPACFRPVLARGKKGARFREREKAAGVRNR